jgi:anthranilate 1,2-dioxygenase small subunit
MSDSAIREQVSGLVLHAAQVIDDAEYEAWPALFTKRCFYQIIGRAQRKLGRTVGMMRAESRAMLEDRVTALRRVNVFEPHTYCHVLGPTQVTGRAADGAWEARTHFIVTRTMHDGPSTLFAAGRYFDTVEIGPAGARFRRREVVAETGIVDTLIVIPL